MGVLFAEAVRRKNERHTDDVCIVRRWKAQPPCQRLGVALFGGVGAQSAGRDLHEK